MKCQSKSEHCIPLRYIFMWWTYICATLDSLLQSVVFIYFLSHLSNSVHVCIHTTISRVIQYITPLYTLYITRACTRFNHNTIRMRFSFHNNPEWKRPKRSACDMPFLGHNTQKQCVEAVRQAYPNTPATTSTFNNKVLHFHWPSCIQYNNITVS